MEDKERWFVYKGKKHSCLTNGKPYKAIRFYGELFVGLLNHDGNTSIISLSDVVETDKPDAYDNTTMIIDFSDMSIEYSKIKNEAYDNSDHASLEDCIAEDIELLGLKDYEGYKTKIDNFLSIKDITIDQMDFLLDDLLEVNELIKEEKSK